MSHQHHSHPGHYNSHEHGGPKKLSDKLKDMTKIKIFGRSSKHDERSSRQSTDSVDDDSAFHLETIDTSPIAESDIFFSDCEAFLKTAENTIDFAKRTASSKGKFDPLKMSQKINKWRAKRKGNKLFMDFDSLITRSDQIEKDMKQITDQSLNDCTSLLIQAAHLRSRLRACIEFNTKEVEKLRPFVDKTKEYLGEIQAYKHAVELMILFFDEVAMIKKSQPEPYIPWAMRAVANPDSMKEVPMKREVLEKRLLTLHHIYEKTNEVLVRDGKIYEIRRGNLEHCERSLVAMENLLVKLNSYRIIMASAHETTTQENPIMASTKSNNTEEDNNSSIKSEGGDDAEDSGKMSTDNEEEHEKLPIPDAYDHTQCADCSCVYVLANDCSMHLAAVQHFAQESTRRLQHLFSVRERMKEKAEVLESIDWGDSIG